MKVNVQAINIYLIFNVNISFEEFPGKLDFLRSQAQDSWGNKGNSLKFYVQAVGKLMGKVFNVEKPNKEIGYMGQGHSLLMPSPSADPNLI